MSSVVISKQVAAMRLELDAMLAEPVDGSAAERAAATAAFESFVRALPAMQHRLLLGLAEVPAAESGETSVARALTTLLRVSRKDANRRIEDAKELGPRAGLTGEVLDPVLTCTAAAQRRGDIGFDHVKTIRRFFRRLPHFVDHETREAAEAQLADLACGLGPEELRKAADRLAVLLDQDGTLSEADRRTRSWINLGPQQSDGTRSLRGRLTPEAGAIWDAVTAKLAAPGMCQPDDDTPCVDGEPTDDQRRSDTRTAGQRNHDAFVTALRTLLASGKLGSHKGLPVTMVVTTTLPELSSAAGHAVTGGGTLLPMRDVIRLASAAHQYLCVFDGHTEEPLYMGRAKRLATKAQRLAMYSRDRGCTRPGCTASAYRSEAHHDEGWVAGQAPTDITTMSLACSSDNQMLERTGWTTRKRKDGRTEWLPPPNLDTGQARVNNYHHPERYLIPDENDSRGSRDDEDAEKP
jgi:hypothetical protein